MTLCGRLEGLVAAYVALGNTAEAAGDCRRAASYRSVANMLGVAFLGMSPTPVDFLARYPHTREPS